MSNKRAIIVVVLLLVAVNLTFGVRWYLAAHSTKASNACVNNLRQIIAAKEQWAQEQHKTTNDVPAWDDLKSHVPQSPVCPGGGTYTVGRIGELPTCSLGGQDHSVPAN